MEGRRSESSYGALARALDGNSPGKSGFRV